MNSSPSCTQASIALRLKARAEHLNINQAELARLTNSTKSVVSAWFNGKNLPRAEGLADIARHLDCSIDWLLTGNAVSQVSDSGLVQLPRLKIGESIETCILPESALVIQKSAIENADISNAVWFKLNDDYAHFKKGDNVVVNLNEQKLFNNRYYAFNVNGEAVIRYVQVKLDGSVCIAHTDNSEEYTVSEAKSLSIIGRVIWVAGSY